MAPRPSDRLAPSAIAPRLTAGGGAAVLVFFAASAVRGALKAPLSKRPYGLRRGRDVTDRTRAGRAGPGARAGNWDALFRACPFRAFSARTSIETRRPRQGRRPSATRAQSARGPPTPRGGLSRRGVSLPLRPAKRDSAFGSKAAPCAPKARPVRRVPPAPPSGKACRLASRRAARPALRIADRTAGILPAGKRKGDQLYEVKGETVRN